MKTDNEKTLCIEINERAHNFVQVAWVGVSTSPLPLFVCTQCGKVIEVSKTNWMRWLLNIGLRRALRENTRQLARIADSLSVIALALTPPAPDTEITFTSIEKFKSREKQEQEALDREEIEYPSMWANAQKR